MALTKTDTAESQFRVSVAVAGVRRFVLTLLSALLVGCGGDSDSAADTAAPQAAPLQEQILVFTQAGPLNLVVGDTLSNVASGGLGTGVIRYSSSDTTVATVDATGQLMVVGAGIATITAEKAADTQYAAASAGYDVSATPAPQDPGPEPQRIGFDQPGPLSLVVGDTLSNVASGGPGTGVIRYSSSDTTIATVDAAGQLTVVGAGIAMITAEKAADTQYAAASASYLVQTTQASQAIGFDQPGPFHLMVGDTLSNAASGGSGTGVISYSSSNTTVATVDAAGELTVVGIGTAEITAEKAADAQYTAASASYTVNAPSRVSVTAWVGRENAEVQVDLPLSTSGMAFFRSNEANCDLSNVHSCANGQSNIVHGGQTVTDTTLTVDPTLTVNPTAYYTLQHGANQASLEVSSTSTERFRERSDHQVVAHNNRLWLIGGWDGSAVKNDVWWSQDGVTWTEVPPEARGSEHFSPRDGHQVVAHNDRLWLIGGWDGGYKNDVWWSQDGVTWIEATGSADFSPRDEHQVVAYKNRLWLIGGWDGSARNNDVWWSQDGVTWTEVPPEARGSEHFSPRDGHQVVAHNDRLWLIGGWDGGYKNDVWWSQDDGRTWKEVVVTGEHFSPRSQYQAVVHDNKLWVIGGWDGSANNNDVWWSQDGATWTEVPPEARGSEHFSPRSQYQAVAHNDRLWLIGGWDGGYKNDVWWSQDGETWESRTRFSPREAHQVVVHNNRLWVIGGLDGSGRKNDVWWSVDGVNWTEVPNNGDRFSPRSDHQAVSFKDKLWVIGGSEGTDDSKDDIWYSEDDGRTWKEVVVTGDQLSGRSRHQVVVHKSAVSNEDELFLIGGWDGGDHNVQGQSGYKSDVWQSADGVTWKQVTASVNTTNIRDNDLNVGIQVVSYKEQLWIINGFRHDIWASQEQVDGSMTWTQYRPTGVPNITTHHNLLFGVGRHNNQAVVHNDRLWLIGGYDGSHKNDVWWSEDGVDWKIEVDVSNNVGTPGFLPPFPPRQKHGFVSYNNRLWVIGGTCNENKEACIVAPGGKNDVWRSEDGENWRLGFHDVFEFQ